MPFHVAPNNPIIRGLYINDFIDPAKPVILGNAVREAQVLQFCVNHQINYIALYDLDRGLFNWSSSASTLRSFITKARTSGITQVAAALSSSSGAVNRLRTYNNACANNNQRFDYLTI